MSAEFLRKYNTATHVYVPIVKRGVVDYAVSGDWTPAAGDVKVSKDGGAAANVTNLPTAIAMGNGAVWDFSLTATELQAAKVVVTVVDAATKAVEDQCFEIVTFGHASAEFPPDFSDAMALGLSRIDAAVSSRADGAVYTAGRGAKLDNLDTNVGSRLATSGYTAPDNSGISTAATAAASAAASAASADTKATGIKAKTDALPGDPASNAQVLTRAAAGDAMTLTGGERNAVADALLDRADGVETGETPRQTFRLLRAANVGQSNGFPDGPVHFRDKANTKNRITASTDPDGNRTAVTTDAT